MSIKLDSSLYTNPGLNLQEDLKSLAISTFLSAIVTIFVQRAFLWPITRSIFKEPPPKFNAKAKQANEKPTVGSNTAELRSRKTLSKPVGDDSSTRTLTDDDCGQRALENKRWKFVIAATKLISYVVFLSYGWWALRDQQDWFWDDSAFHLAFPNNQTPPALKGLYMMETGYYLFTIIAMFFEPRMKDRVQMFCHHVFTITLLTTSYYYNAVKYGTIIMMLHDFSDPWMEAAKLFNYCGKELFSGVFFFVFASSFIYLRTYIYPRYIIRSTFVYARPLGYPCYWVTFACLVGLWGLHCFWSYLIAQVFYENVIKRSGKGDVREDD